ncbi:hypothetical protein [Aliifodinibius sp. S!AR15-10]|uniref:tetratricopeptide repeat protein n=1 Tax=Aliifodinibius sp. S!AR15-10 TaxID=2950437 RepID=UPI002870B19E|nr:hypothetical protein [Aliifodinibius sp. S!AR15-10]
MQEVDQGNEQVSSSAMGFKGFLYGKVGLTKEARSILSYLNEVNKRSYVPPAAFAYVYIGLGEYDEALDWLEKAYEERDVSIVWIKANKWMFDYISAEPRFQSLLDDMNFPDF